MEYRPLDGREFPRFSGIKTFFRLPHVPLEADYDVGIVGVPFDGGASYRVGARFAPSRIRETTSLGRGFHMGRSQNFLEKLKVADIGDCPVVPISIEKTYEKIESHFDRMLQLNKRFIAVGGDHSTTLPILRALKKKYGTVALIHFDAHFDTYPGAWGCEYHHGTFVRHAVEEKLIDVKKSFQIGIRGPLASGKDLDFNQDHDLKAFTIDDLRIEGLENFLRNLPSPGNHPTYISFDVDCLDPVYAPGTGTPVPGGLTTYETQRILRALKIPKLVGCDIVEVSPPYDVSELTTLAAMDTMFEMLNLF